MWSQPSTAVAKAASQTTPALSPGNQVEFNLSATRRNRDGTRLADSSRGIRIADCTSSSRGRTAKGTQKAGAHLPRDVEREVRLRPDPARVLDQRVKCLRAPAPCPRLPGRPLR